MFNTKKGFTLIELLIVIGIIGVLSGILFAVIDPAGQRLKAQQAIVRTNVEKMCLAKTACINADSGGLAANCATLAQIGANNSDNNPAGSTYNPAPAATTVSGTLGACTYTCTTNTGTITAAGCVTQ